MGRGEAEEQHSLPNPHPTQESTPERSGNGPILGQDGQVFLPVTPSVTSYGLPGKTLDQMTLWNWSRHQVLMLVAQSCLTLCNPMDCSPPGSSVHGISQARITGMGGHSLLQGIFPTQGSNPHLLHCRQIHYRLSDQGSLLLGMT